MRRSSMSRVSMLLSLFLMLCFATTVLAQEQANEIVCSTSTACTSGFIPIFSTNGGRAKVINSLFKQSGTTVSLNANETVSGNLAASGTVSGSAGSFTGNLAAGGTVSGSAGSFSGSLGLKGNLSMAGSTGTAGNVLKAGSLFLHNFGLNNTFVGLNAGNLTMVFSANNNAGFGTNALSANTTGCCNTATGNNALLHNTTGGGNTASGDGALYTNTTGNSNTALGRWALISNSAGSFNTAIGVTALQNNSAPNGITGSASYNTAAGYQALNANTTGGYNTATGYQALYSNVDGYFNTASGESALGLNLHGSSNTASGYSALYGNTSGSGNTAFGWDSLGGSTGDNNTAIGSLALAHNGPGTYNTAIGYGADVPESSNITNSTAIGNGAIVTTSNTIVLGNSAVTVVEGPPYSVVSDKNKKENFEVIDAEEVLRKVRDLSVTTWNYIGHDPGLRHYGPVAQEFFAAFGSDGRGTIGSPTTIASTDLDGILLLAIQALEKRMAELQTLKTENADLKARLEKLERASGSR